MHGQDGGRALGRIRGDPEKVARASTTGRHAAKQGNRRFVLPDNAMPWRFLRMANPQGVAQMLFLRRHAFTLTELLVVIAIIAVLAAILFPVFAQARAAARKAVCMSNEKQIATGILMYFQDYDDRTPRAVNNASSSPH